MSFFGFEQGNLEEERKRFLQDTRQNQDLAVYTWGEESYDGLGDALQERGDELNEETFGSTESVGKDFDFGAQVLPDHHLSKPSAPIGSSREQESAATEIDARYLPVASQPFTSPSSRPNHSLESRWDDRSAFSVLPRVSNGSGRPADRHLHASTPQHDPSPARLSPYLSDSVPVRSSPGPVFSDESAISRTLDLQGIRTLQEIEAEMQVTARIPQRHLLDPQLQSISPPQPQHPPPRMHPHAQSPRFHQLQQQILIQQRQQQQFQQQQLHELQEQLRMEEIERQLRAQHISQLQQQQLLNQRRQSPMGPTLAEIQAAQQLAQLQQEQRRRQRSPGPGPERYQMATPFDESTQYLPQNIQLQQRLLAELAQAEFIRDYGQSQQSQEEQEAVRAEAMRKIMEAERMEERRRRKAAKINHMSRYNDLMTQSDKDFITRIQVSQLVTQDPYAEDYYAQIYGALMRARMGLNPDQHVLRFTSGVGVGLGLPGQRPSGRKLSAVQRMEAQVERIVNNARQRERDKGLASLTSLQGALGKTSGRSYKAAPRQLLQVDAPKTALSPQHTSVSLHGHVSHDGHDAEDDGRPFHNEALERARLSLGEPTQLIDGEIVDPLTRFEVLAILEHLWELVLRLDQLEHERPGPEDDDETIHHWNNAYADACFELRNGLRLNIAIETHPHPFVSLLAPLKGKRLLPRIRKYLDEEQLRGLVILLAACFSQLDVVVRAPILDSTEDTPERRDVERHTQAFDDSVLHETVTTVNYASLELVNGWMGLLFDHNDVVAVCKTRPGLTFLTLLLSRVESINQELSQVGFYDPEQQLQEEHWANHFKRLLETLEKHFLELFPSIRMGVVIDPSRQDGPCGNLQTELSDQPVWRFLALIAVHAGLEQKRVIISGLRDKILGSVWSIRNGRSTDEEERRIKLMNVNILLGALGLDINQIAL